MNDLRITIFDAKFSAILKTDASGEITAAQYENTPVGCASAAFATSLGWSTSYKRGYYKGRNGVEVSTGDDVLQHAIASISSLIALGWAGATIESAAGAVARVYISDLTKYDPAVTGAKARLYLWDGATLTMGLDVVAVGTDATGPYCAVKLPAIMPGNPAAIAAYSVGPTIVGRRRWAGRIARRDRKNKRSEKMSFACVGIQKRLEERLADIQFNATEISTAVFTTIDMFAASFSDLVISAANFPAVGATYSGSRSGSKVSDCIVEQLAANSSGDLWTVSVLHDREPKLRRLYTQATNTYAFNSVLPQRSAMVRATEVTTADEDTGGMFNSVRVNGDTDPNTGRQASAISQDFLSIGDNLQIDAPAVSNTALKTDSACAALAQSLLNQQAIPVATNSVEIVVTQPAGGGPAADVVNGFECITIGGFDSGGSTINDLPDSDLVVATGIGAVWSTVGAPALGQFGPSGAWAWLLNPADRVISAPFDRAPGTQVTISAYIDTSNVTAGTPYADLTDVAQTTVALRWNLPLGVVGRRTFTGILVTPWALGSLVFRAAGNGATITAGQHLVVSQPMVQVGPVNLGYVANDAAPAIFGLATSVVTNIAGPSGLKTQTIRFKAVEPDWNAYVRERTAAVVNAILANRRPQVSIDQYTVSTDAYPAAGIPTSGLNVNVPAFAGIFAKNTPIEVLGTVVLALPGTATTWAWVSSGNVWTLKQDPSSVAGAILYAMFTTTATVVTGQRPGTAPGVVKVGVGNVNVGNHPTPAGTSTLAQGSTNSSVHSQVVASVNLTNVPTDDSVSALVFGYRIHGTSDPLTVTDGVPLARRTAVQAVSLGFAIGAGQNIDAFCAYAGLASGDYGPGWAQLGTAAQIAAGFTAQPLVVTVPYMIGSGVAAAPVCPIVTGPPALPSFVPAATVNGLSGSFVISWKITNHPQDGSCRRIAIYRRIYNATTPAAYEWYASMPVAAAPNPPLAVVYGIQPADLTNGQQYDWSCAFENAQGAESPLGFIGTSPVVKIDLGSAAFKAMGAVIAAAGPQITAAAVGAPLSGGGVASQPFTVTFSDWTNGNIPDWGAGIFVVLRKAVSHEPIGDPVGYSFPSNPVNVQFTSQIPSGMTVDIGFYYHDTANRDSNVWWPPAAGAGSALGGIVGGQINAPQTIAGGASDSKNAVQDGNFTHRLTYWKSVGTPALVTPAASNYLTSGVTAITGIEYSQPIPVAPGDHWMLSMFGAGCAVGGNCSLNVVPASDAASGLSSFSTVYKQIAVATGFTGGHLNAPAPWIVPAGVTSVCVAWYYNNAQNFVATEFQLEKGDAFTGFSSNVPVDPATGSQAKAAAHADYQLTVQTGGGINVASALHSNKNLDNVPAGATYGAVNTAYRAADGSGRIAPVIDFAMSGNVNKTQDNVAAGATYGRTDLTHLYTPSGGGSAPLIDFAYAGQLNKNLDNVGDGSTYGRVTSYYRYTDGSGRFAPLTDFSYAQLNKNLDNVGDGSSRSGIRSNFVYTDGVYGVNVPLLNFAYSGHPNKNLDSLPDGATYGKTDLSYLYTDGSSHRAPIIDVSSGLHISKNLNSIPDGSTYGRPILTRLVSGKPIVDLSESGNTNRTQDYIADGSTYGRLNLAYVYTDGSSRRGPLIDFGAAGHISKNLDSIGDGSTYGRPMLSRLSGGKPFIDFGEAANLNKQLDNVVDGATYGRSVLTRLVSGKPIVDLSEAGNLGRTQDNIADGATYGRTNLAYLYADGSGRRAPLIDFSAAGHLSKTFDFIAPGTINRPASLSSGGASILENGDFSIAGLSAFESAASPVYYLSRYQNFGSVGTWTVAQEASGNTTIGGPDMLVRLVSSQTIPGSTSYLQAIKNTTQIMVRPAEILAVSATARVDSNTALPAGLSKSATVYLRFYTAAGAYVGDTVIVSATAAEVTTPLSVTVPATAGYAIVFCQTVVTNSNVGSVVLGSGLYCDARYGAFTVKRSTQLDNDVIDGASYGRPLTSRLAGGKPFIDFSEASNLNKNVDQLADGATHGRLNLAYLYSDGSGRRAPVIDFAAAGHVNKTQDNVADGSSYKRVAAAAFQSGNSQFTHAAMSPGVGAGVASDGATLSEVYGLFTTTSKNPIGAGSSSIGTLSVAIPAGGTWVGVINMVASASDANFYFELTAGSISSVNSRGGLCDTTSSTTMVQATSIQQSFVAASGQTLTFNVAVITQSGGTAGKINAGVVELRMTRTS